jgi:hypothetical protein
MAIWCILWSYGIFSPLLVCCTKKNLATLVTCIYFVKKFIKKNTSFKTFKTLQNMYQFCPYEVKFRTFFSQISPHLVTLNPSEATVFSSAGLPDGFFSDQNDQYVFILENRGMENVVTYMFWSFGVFYNHWVQYILWALGILQSFGIVFPPFGILYHEKSGNPAQVRLRSWLPRSWATSTHCQILIKLNLF